MHALVLLHFSWILVKNVYIEYIFCFYYNCMFIFKGDHPFDRRLSIVTYVWLFMSSRHVLRQHVRVRNLSVVRRPDENRPPPDPHSSTTAVVSAGDVERF